MALESLKDQMDNTNPPRVKAEKFDKFMQEREVGGFHKEAYDDQFRTVVYFSGMQTAGQQPALSQAVRTLVHSTAR